MAGGTGEGTPGPDVSAESGEAGVDQIPKPDGKQRPLGIPTIRDRVVQMAAVVVLEPIFEADLPSEQHAYRPGKSALDAIQRSRRY